MWELMVKGGWVMLPVVACSIVGAILFLERVFHLHRAQIKQDDFLSGIYTIVNRGNTAEAVSICDQTPGPVAHMVRTGLLHANDPPEELKATINKAGLLEVPRLEKNLGGLLTVAQIAPMLGLLGTVIGLVRVFMVMEMQAPLAEIGDLSAGIWEALISTAAGICVGVPAFAGYNFLISRVEAITLNMESAADELCRFLINEQKDDKDFGDEAL